MAPVPQFIRDTLDNIVHEARRPDREVRVMAGTIELEFRYNGALHSSLIREVRGVSYAGRSGIYSAPLAAARDVYRWCVSRDFTGLDSLDEHVRRAEALRDLTEWSDAECYLPKSFDDLRPYQRVNVRYATNAKRTFIADEMGLGKTPVALAAIEARGAYPAVVVCPASLRINWQREARRWLPHRSTQVLTGTRGAGRAVLGGVLGQADITIVNYDVLHAWERQLGGAFAVVFDESHYCKSNDRGPMCPDCDVKVPRVGKDDEGPFVCSNGHPYMEPLNGYKVRRTRAAQRLSERVVPLGLVLALTGTPITNRVEEFVSQLDILGLLDYFGGQAAFLARYGDDRNLDELNERLRGIGYIRHRKVDAGIADELPPKLWAARLVEGDAGPMAEYRRAEEDIITFLAERAAAIAKELGEDPQSAATMAALRAGAAEHLVRVTTLKKLAARTKGTATKEWVEGMLAADEQVVVAAHHREIVDEVAARYDGVRIQGGMSVEQVEAAKAKFQAGEADVMVLSIQAGKTGHTLTAASNIAFIELPWTPGDLDQTSDRLHRIGQTDSVTAWALLAKDTIDEDIYDLIERKRKVVTRATDGHEIGLDVDNEAEEMSTLGEIVELLARRGLNR